MLMIKEAIERLNEKRKEPITMIAVAKELWEDSAEQTQRMNITRMASGSIKSIKIDHVEKLCRVLECDANYLFGQSKK